MGRPPSDRPESAAALADAELVRRARDGDTYAFGMLYEKHFPAIFRFAFFRTSDESTAEDIASGVFMKAWSKLDSYEIRGTPWLAWLYTIARNEIIAHYRRSRPTADLDEALSVTDGEQPEAQLELALDVEKLQVAMRELTEDQAQVLSLKFFEGLNTHEIARLMGKQEGAVRALQMRALQSLKQRIGEEP